VPPPSDILKYFHEEPALLEPVTPDADPDARRREERSDLPENVSVPLEDLLDTRDAYRGYLAGTNRAEETVGLTALRDPDTFVTPVVKALGQAWWGRCTTDGTVEALDEGKAREVLANPADTAVLVTAEAPVDPERIAAVAGRARRRALPALRALLDVSGPARRRARRLLPRTGPRRPRLEFLLGRSDARPFGRGPPGPPDRRGAPVRPSLPARSL